MIGRKCCVPKCGKNYSNNPEFKFYAFPKDPKLKRQWMENLKKKKLLNKVSYVCSIHFEDKVKCQMKLRKNAVPTLHLGYDGLVPHQYIKHQTVKRKCCIESCKRKNLYKNRALYKFPDNIDEKYAWAQACNLPLPLPKKIFFICDRHFERKYVSRTRRCADAFPKFFLHDEDDENVKQSDEESNASDEEQSSGRRKAPGMKLNEVLPVKLTYSRDIKEEDSDDISTEESEDVEQSLHEEQIQNLQAQIEGLRKRVTFLKNSAIYPQPGTSEESLTFSRMIVGDKKTGYTEKEKALAKKLRSNMFSDDYSFLKQNLGFRLPLLKAVKRNKNNLPENDRKLIN